MATDGDLTTDGREQYDGTDNAWEAIPAVVCKALTADETAKSEDTTVAAATGLSTPITAGTTRRVEFDLIVSSAAAADIDIAVFVPDNAVGDVTVNGTHADVETEVSFATAGVGTEEHCRVTAVVTAGADDSGNIELHWAQTVSTASDTVVHKGSSVVSLLANG